MLLNIIFIANLIVSKLRNFDLFFINNRKKLAKIYMSIYLKTSIKYAVIIYFIFSIKEGITLNNLVIILFYELSILGCLFLLYEIFSNFKFNFLIILLGVIYIFISNYVNNDILNCFIIDLFIENNEIYFKCEIYYIILLNIVILLLYYNLFNKKKIIC